MAIDISTMGIDLNPRFNPDLVLREEQNQLIREIRDLADESRYPRTDDAPLRAAIEAKGMRLKEITPAPPSVVVAAEDLERHSFYRQALDS